MSVLQNQQLCEGDVDATRLRKGAEAARRWVYVCPCRAMAVPEIAMSSKRDKQAYHIARMHRMAESP